MLIKALFYYVTRVPACNGVIDQPEVVAVNVNMLFSLVTDVNAILVLLSKIG